MFILSGREKWDLGTRQIVRAMKPHLEAVLLFLLIFIAPLSNCEAIVYLNKKRATFIKWLLCFRNRDKYFIYIILNMYNNLVNQVFSFPLE